VQERADRQCFDPLTVWFARRPPPANAGVGARAPDEPTKPTTDQLATPLHWPRGAERSMARLGNRMRYYWL